MLSIAMRYRFALFALTTMLSACFGGYDPSQPVTFAPGTAVPEEGVELFHRVNLQDFAACERTQPGMSSRAYRAGGVLVPSEHHIGGFHRWVTDLLA